MVTNKKGIGLTLALVVTILALVGLFWYAYQPFYPDDRIFTGVKIVGINIGGMTKQEVNKALEGKITKYNKQPIVIYYEKNKNWIYPKDINFRFDVDELTNKAIDIGRRGSLFERIRERWKTKNTGIDIEPDFEHSRGKIEEKILQFAKKIERKPQNAIYAIKNNKAVLISEIKGLKVGIDKSIDRVENALTSENKLIALAVEIKEPSVTKSTFEKQGIKEAIGSFTTSFKTSQASRKHNIRIAAAAFNNTIIKPKDKFSFNKIIKDKKVDKKYQVAKIIKNNKFVLGDGGGVCQVSTTLYNSILLANIKVIERSHHSVPVGYVPLGRDATVSENISDFRFQNNSPGSIMILTSIKDDQLTFYIIGTPIKEKTQIKLVSELIKKESQETTEVLDNNLPKGVVKTEKGSPFYEVKVYREQYKNGILIKRNVVSHDKYKKVDNEIRIGTADPWSIGNIR